MSAYAVLKLVCLDAWPDPHRICGERLDIWVLRHAGHVQFGFHGLNKTKSCTVEEAREAARAIWFIDGAYDARY